MAAPIFDGFTIEFDERALVARLEGLPKKLSAALKVVIARLTQQMLDRVIAAEPNKTGKLRSETKKYVDVTDTYVRGRVRVLNEQGSSRPFNLKASALEYGAHRAFKVKAYQRKSVLVKAYTRRANITAHSFLRNSLASTIAQATAEIERSIQETMNKAA